MAGEKYIVATSENSFHISVRNTLNPAGYVFLDNCCDAVSLLRLVRSYHPDFIIVDTNMLPADTRYTLEIIDGEMLCAVIIAGDKKNVPLYDFVEKSNTGSYCLKPLNREMLFQTIEMANISFKRISNLNKKLTEMTENYETRKSVERAKWILMERDDISEKEAYEKIRKKSMNGRMTIKAIADAIVFTYDIANKADNT